MTREQVLMAARLHEGEAEAEPVVARLTNDRLVLTLDDGDIVDLDAREVFGLFAPHRDAA